jgi:hypothetical protein
MSSNIQKTHEDWPKTTSLCDFISRGEGPKKMCCFLIVDFLFLDYDVILEISELVLSRSAASFPES